MSRVLLKDVIWIIEESKLRKEENKKIYRTIV